jgi:capsular polysaccharide biosynthesis protein
MTILNVLRSVLLLIMLVPIVFMLLMFSVTDWIFQDVK